MGLESLGRRRPCSPPSEMYNNRASAIVYIQRHSACTVPSFLLLQVPASRYASCTRVFRSVSLVPCAPAFGFSHVGRCSRTSLWDGFRIDPLWFVISFWSYHFISSPACKALLRDSMRRDHQNLTFLPISNHPSSVRAPRTDHLLTSISVIRNFRHLSHSLRDMSFRVR